MTGICPKCGYVIKEGESVPGWQCPSCRFAYNKYLKNGKYLDPGMEQKRQEEEQAEKTKKAIDRDTYNELVKYQRRALYGMFGSIFICALLGALLSGILGSLSHIVTSMGFVFAGLSCFIYINKIRELKAFNKKNAYVTPGVVRKADSPGEYYFFLGVVYFSAMFFIFSGFYFTYLLLTSS